jgi:hypothetical protein
LNLLVDDDELAERGLVYLEILDTDTENPLDNPLFRTWLLYFAAERSKKGDEPHFYDTVAARYLERGMGSPERRRFIDLARRQPFSFWRVEAVGPGPWLQLADMFWRRTHRVYAPELVVQAPVGHALLGHVVADGEIAILVIAAGAFDPGSQFAIRQLAERAGPALDGLHALSGWDTEILTLFDAWQHREYPLTTSPTTTIEGHPFVMIDRLLQYPGRGREELLRVLGAEPEFEVDGAADASDSKVVVGWNGPPLDGGEPVLPHGAFGVLFVAYEAISALSVSSARAEALEARLAELLGPPDELVTISEEPAEDRRAVLERIVDAHAGNAAAHGESSDEKTARLAASITPEEAKRLQRTMDAFDVALRERFLSWPDVRNPDLDDRTPREALADARGAERVLALVDAWERRAHRVELRNQDFSALRADLGLPPPTWRDEASRR